MTATALSTELAERSLVRKVIDTCGAYIRIDLVEERMFPLSMILRYVGLVFPVLLYFFQSDFLHLGGNNFAFMLIGTAMTAGLSDALGGLTGRLQFAQERGTLETYLVEPVPWAIIPVAMNIYRSFSGGVLAVLMILFGALLGAPIHVASAPLALVVLLLGITACNVIGSLAASFLILFKRGEPVIMFYGLAAGVLGGALFPTSVLPAWIRWMSYVVPHSYVINATRRLLMTHPPHDGLSPLASVGALGAFSVFGMWGSLLLFDKSLHVARRLGVLGV